VSTNRPAVTAVSYLTGCETWLVGNNNMPWGEIFSVPRQNIHGEFGIQAAKVAIFCPEFSLQRSVLK
jgi:hypothetical protein